MQNRENVRLAVKVRTGILIDAVNGASAAWAYMMHYRVPRHVILRVLAAPARRRTSDARHPLSEQETRRLGNLPQLQRRYLTGNNVTADPDNGDTHHSVDRGTASFFPLPTLKTKNTVRLLQPGMRLKIDAVNVENPYDCIEVDTWLVVKSDGLHFRYQDGPGGRQVDLGNAEAVRIAIEAAPTAD